MIDPHIQGMLDAMVQSGFALPQPLDAGSLRAMLDAPIPAPPIDIAERRDFEITGDSVSITARLYHPSPGKILPVILFFHGGGWVHGTLDTHDRLAAILAVQTGCALVSVDYRLAPEHPFPAAWQDAILAFEWVSANAAKLGVDASSIALAGDSAGGNIAAALAQAKSGDPVIKHQLLFYPAVDGTCSSRSFAQEHPGFLSSAQMRWYWDQYAPGMLRNDPRASPALATISPHTAPATIIVAGNDPLYGEGVAYANALMAAGVPADLCDYPGAIHGFASLFGIVPLADDAIASASAAVRASLQPAN